MAKRITDIVLALVGLVLSAPLLIGAAVGVRLSSRGPIFYLARRMGLDGRCFTMFKIRTMHVRPAEGSRITAERDSRVFWFGSLLRLSKLDEVPQFLNVLLGDMSIVGPRPEDPGLVGAHYAPAHYETLRLRPGLTSPGTIFDYTHGDLLVGPDNPEENYAERLLPLKLALDLVYVRRASWLYDMELVIRTVWVMLCTVLGRRRFMPPREYEAAQLLDDEVRAQSAPRRVRVSLTTREVVTA
jgi:lipopolysaccharide/colanic/teichoic acid biosynthesis glycosyltransferase